MGYMEHLLPNRTPQDRPIPGREHEMVKNDAGGYVFGTGVWAHLHRFIVLGTEGGTYYANERHHTLRAGRAVWQAIAEDGLRAVEMVADILERGRAYRVAPGMLVLAMAAASDDENVRRAALEALPRVARTGTHLFTFVRFLDELRGWGRMARRYVGRWYTGQPVDRLAYRMIKYQSRTVDGQRWSHADVLRLAHPKPRNVSQDILFRWATRGDVDTDVISTDGDLRLLAVYETVRRAKTENEIIRLIREHGLTWEFVPGQWLGSRAVWEALFPHLPYMALVRNLGRLGALGILKPLSSYVSETVRRITDAEAVRRSRVHPMHLLLALETYRRGAGMRGNLRWPVVAQVVDALDQAFRFAFENVEPSGSRILIGLDVSGSMGAQILGTPLSARTAAAAMAFVQVATEPLVHVMAFSDTFREFPMSANDTVQAITDRMARMPFGRTDCALPMLYALKHVIQVDTFIVYTDNETWYGQVHPMQALAEYRREINPNARLAVVGMTATNFTIADPNDPGTLDVVGFDTATPRILADFAGGRV